MELSIFTKQRELVRATVDSFDDWNNIEVATLLEPSKDLLELFKRNGQSFEIVDYHGISCCVMHRDLYFYHPPLSAKSSGSKAIYYARSMVKMDGLLLQYLPPQTITSKHYHTAKIETYHNLEGRCLIEVDGEDILLEQSSHKIPPNVVHQVRTEDDASLTLLEIIGDPNGLSMDDHHYVE